MSDKAVLRAVGAVLRERLSLPPAVPSLPSEIAAALDRLTAASEAQTAAILRLCETLARQQPPVVNVPVQPVAEPPFPRKRTARIVHDDGSSSTIEIDA